MYKDKVTLAEGIKRFFAEVMYVGIGDDACNEAANIIRKKVGETNPGLPFSGIRGVTHLEDSLDSDYFSAVTLGSTHEYSIVEVNGKSVVDHKSDIVIGFVMINTFPDGKVRVGEFTDVKETPTRTIYNKGVVGVNEDVFDQDVDYLNVKENDFCGLIGVIADLQNDEIQGRNCVFKISLHTETVELKEKKYFFFKKNKVHIMEQYFCVDVMTMNCPSRNSDGDEEETDKVKDDKPLSSIAEMLNRYGRGIPPEVLTIEAGSPEEALRKFEERIRNGLPPFGMEIKSETLKEPEKKVSGDPMAIKKEEVLSFLEDKIEYLVDIDPESYKGSIEEIKHLLHNDVILSRLVGMVVDFDSPDRLLQRTQICDFNGDLFSRFVSQISQTRSENGNIVEIPCVVKVKTEITDISRGTDEILLKDDTMSAVIIEKDVDENNPNDFKYEIIWAVRKYGHDDHEFRKKLEII